MSIQSTLFLFFITAFSTQAFAETCETNPGSCTPVQLCEKSTEVLADKTYWIADETNSYLKVARQFGLDCGASEAPSTCQQDADECGVVELCKIATTLTGYETFWNQDHKKHVKIAKSFGLNCGVSASVATEQPVPKSNSSNALSRCEENLSECVASDLCQTATYGMLGAKDWKIGSYVKFVDEAKRRGLRCDVISEPQEDKTYVPVHKDELEPVILKARDSCEADLIICNEAVLCELATYGPLGNKDWKVENYTNFIEEAARRNISCGVSISATEALAKIIHQPVTPISSPDPIIDIVRLNAHQICDENLAGCRTLELCELATFGMAGAIEWKIGNFIKFVDEAKRRSENCGVLNEEQILAFKSDTELCSYVTHESSKGIRWNVGSEKIFIEEAQRTVNTADVFEEVQRRVLNCNVKHEELVDLDVAQIQTRLHHFDYDPGLIDGGWGEKTEMAFQQFLTNNSQSSLLPKSLEAETFLYDLYEQKFEQTVSSSVPCETITKDYERTNMGTCVVIAHFDETSSNLVSPEKGDETTGIWDKRGIETTGIWDKRGIYPAIRKANDKSLEIVMWAPDMSEKVFTVHDGPGLAHMASFGIDLEAIFKNRTKISIKNNTRKMPFSVRRYTLNDLDNDGNEELFLLGSREDGRGGGNYKRLENMFDYNFIYDFGQNKITTFGQRSFSHDYGIHDFDNDGFKDILDMALSKKAGYFYCDGMTLNCAWRSTDQFINEHSVIAHDLETKKVLLNARCGKRYVTDDKFWLCWFSVEGTGSKLKFELIQKTEMQKPFDAKIRWMAWHGDIKPLMFQGWKVDGYAIDERIRKSAGGTATTFKDLDGDGDLDMITYRKDYDCVKKDLSRNYYNFEDCDQFTHSDYIFLQNDGKFELSEINEGGIRQQTISYDFEDLNKDGHVDIIPRGVYEGKCVETYENILMSSGNGTFDRTDEKYSGRYGCELASNFFEHKGQRYRAFTFKPEVKEPWHFGSDVYLAIEKLQ